MQEAWPNAKVTVVHGSPDPQHVLYLHAVSPDGSWALGQLVPLQVGTSERPSVVMVEVATGRQRKLHEMPSAQSQAGLTDADDRWFVWAEASEQPNFGDWRIFAFDRVDQRLVEVAAAQRQPDGQYLPSSVWPQVDHGIVVWSEELADSTDRFGRIVSFALPGGPATVIASPTRGAAISWPLIAFTRVGSEFAITLFDQRTASETGVKLPAFNYAAIDGTAISWVTGMRELWYRAQSDAPARLVARASAQDGFLQFPRMSPRFIGWQSTSFPGVYDRVLDRVVLVDTPGKDAGWNFVPKGSALLWALPLAPGASPSRTAKDYAILDVSTLPPH